MPKNPVQPLPETATAGQIAKLLGVAERGIYARTGDGRLPKAGGGSIDFRAVVRAGVDALARRGTALQLAQNAALAQPQMRRSAPADDERFRGDQRASFGWEELFGRGPAV